MSQSNKTIEPDTERRILEAAAKVFMIKGKLGASMQDIADEAGINRTLLHYYFRNKDKLFDTVFDKIFEQVFPAMVGIMSSEKPFPERLERFVETYIKLLHENPYLPVFVFQEITLNPGRMANALEGIGFDSSETMKEFSSELEGTGLEGTDPRHLFASLLGMVLFPYLARPIFQTIAFSGDEKAYDKFLIERNKAIPHFMKMALIGTGSKAQSL